MPSQIWWRFSWEKVPYNVSKNKLVRKNPVTWA